MAELLTQAPLPPRSPLEPPVFFASVHKPYAEQACGECHVVAESHALAVLDQTLCLRCHGAQVLRERWDHGPLNFGLCRICHEPHLSRFPHLQSQEQPGLCTHCHDSTSLMTDIEDHRGAEEQRCTDCHDPHRSGVYVADAPLEAEP
jgi:predicted CXXCH cytochrome family protein